MADEPGSNPRSRSALERQWALTILDRAMVVLAGARGNFSRAEFEQPKVIYRPSQSAVS